ncbi:hypothetical protein C8R47DRAFT_1260659 [Mycena vitilis]|nr:hypothetical protein C8R47DRAFT_1260659 [Mycena vitilis]
MQESSHLENSQSQSHYPASWTSSQMSMAADQTQSYVPLSSIDLNAQQTYQNTQSQYYANMMQQDGMQQNTGNCNCVEVCTCGLGATYQMGVVLHQIKEYQAERVRVNSTVDALQQRIAELEVLQRLQEEHRRQQEAEAERRAQEEADEDQAKSSKVLPRAIYHLVAATMADLMGQVDRKGPVPGPLAPGETPPVDENGVPLHRPTWAGNADGTQPLVIDTVKVIWANENASEGLSFDAARTLPAKLGPLDRKLKAMIKAGAIQHWRTRQAKYRAQTTTQGRKKFINKQKYNTTYSRLKRLAASRRLQIEPLKEKYTPEKCVGVEAMIHTPWCSDEGSGPEDADPDAFKARKAATGENSARGRHRQVWRSEQVNRIYAALDTLARAAHSDDHQYVQGGRDRRRTVQHTVRFPDFPQNSYKGHPKGIHVPFESCISETWASQQSEVTHLEDPDNFTIFDLPIPDSDLDAEALALLADDESA